MMGVSSCMSVRQARGACHCPACPRASGHGAMPPQTLVLPPMALEPEATPVKDKKGSKMKVLKKIKKKIGLGKSSPRTTCTGGTPNNLPPLTFNSVHGENIRISRDGSIARRVESFCKGVAFSARPVRVNEKICIRFIEVSDSWSGVIRFGFTSHNPETLPHPIPKYACPDLTNKPGSWAKALGERFYDKDNLLHYYVTSNGDVHFGINGEDKGCFFSNVDTRSPLWALVDVYGNCTAVQFVDPRMPQATHVSPVVEDRLIGSMRSLSVEEPLPIPRYKNPLVPLNLHRMMGRNVQFVNERGIAARVPSEFCQGYVFTARPMRPGQTIIVQILSTDAEYSGSLAIGLTSCDPATLRTCDLPDDAEQLLDRPEYWVVRRDAANDLRRGDELAVTLTFDGEVRIGVNGSAPVTVMHVDHTLKLWAFVDIYGATQKVRMLTSQVMQAQTPPQQLRVLTRSAAPIAGSNGGTVLVVSLPPQNGAQNAVNHQQGLTLASAHYIEPIQSSSQVCVTSLPIASQSQTCSSYQRPREVCSTSQNNSNEQVRLPNGHSEIRLDRYQNGPSTSRPSTSHQPIYSVIGEGLTGTECTICYENPIDSVLYMCGHMCMCYRCAVQQWRGKGGGQCPLCRAQIKDVIRTYKS
ncbi:protein neuralized isoform X1 [Pieris brassicae]|uniref:protein neuralized isoform X1 n=1 Tax=Pieris brassicae TaxID=7116 RepID=UPI001E6622A7|nr:protein neuralized isoform X1 [Pieris brassicae]